MNHTLRVMSFLVFCLVSANSYHIVAGLRLHEYAGVFLTTVIKIPNLYVFS